jgi:poly-gamma-glutamate synthesis protein (capsule biosynthesis protein)
LVVSLSLLVQLSALTPVQADPPDQFPDQPSNSVEAPREITLALVGDLLPEASWRTDHLPITVLYAEVRDQLRRADIAFGNLEEPLTTSEAPTENKNPESVRAGRDFVLRASSPGVAAGLREAGFSIVGLANNHMMDYREQGLLDTLDALRQAGLPAVGAGRRREEAHRAVVVEAKGMRVAFLAFSDVVPANYEATAERAGVASSKETPDLIAAIKSARGQADLLVLSLHWGTQAIHTATERQHELGRLAVEAGCDLVFGGHPHYLQGIEVYQGKPIFYSAGNFQFPTRNPEAQESFIAMVVVRGKGVEQIELVPVLISPQGQPRIVQDSPEGDRILEHVQAYSRLYGTHVGGGRIRIPPGR